MKTTKQKSPSKKEKDDETKLHSTTNDPTKPDSETSHKKIHKIGDPIKKETK